MSKGALRDHRKHGRLTDRQIAKVQAHIEAMGICASRAQQIAQEAGRSFPNLNRSVFGWAEYEAEQGQG